MAQFSPVYGMDPETARRLVEAYRKARFSGTEQGLEEAQRILQEIRSGRYLPPLPEETEQATREFFLPGGGETILEPETHDEENLLTRFSWPEKTALVEEPPITPTPRPVRYSLPERTALTEPVPRPPRYSVPEKTSLTRPTTEKKAQTLLQRGRARAATRRLRTRTTTEQYPSEAARARNIPVQTATAPTLDVTNPFIAMLLNLHARRRGQQSPQTVDPFTLMLSNVHAAR